MLLTKHSLLVLVNFRQYATKSPFTKTVFLPVSTFPPKGKIEVEREIQNRKGFQDIYKWQKEFNKNNETFLLHDGPPYANGDVHVGHAVNKILKDITNRYKLMRGFNVHFVPGWDCHGLPIEIKAFKSGKNQSISSVDIRKASRAFANETIKKQRLAFERWGVMADWENDCYYTNTNDYVVKELDAFYEMYKKGFIYRALMPVYWSPSSVTALAESELEYVETHKSRSAYVSFKLNEISTVLQSFIPSDSNVNVIIWTTQPWTLASNEAICYSHDADYSLIKCDKKYYLICKEQVNSISECFDTCEVVYQIQGKDLSNLKYVNPLDLKSPKRLLPSSDVTTDKGTGFVHMAPAHGHSDFNIAKQFGLTITCHVDNSGCFKDSAGSKLSGKFIFTEGNEIVIEELKKHSSVIKEHVYTHSYPYDWRTKKPIFIKASTQWFVDTSSLKQKVSTALESINIIPEFGKISFLNSLKSRTYWCISRQRSWGVPIPVFYHKPTNEYLLNEHSVEHIKNLIADYGSDCWWTLPKTQLLPQDVLNKSGFESSSLDDFDIGSDILDIWFDSGTSWLCVLGKDKKCMTNTPVADLYLEGMDQYGGWFLSSLLTSFALNKRSPFKTILTHGFVIHDETRKKMSKSLGNVVDPMVITNGGKNLQKDPAFGVDVLRWWVATSNVFTNLAAGKNSYIQTADNLKKLRLRFKFMLGSLSNFNPDQNVEYQDLKSIDKYFLYLLGEYVNNVTESYDEYNYSKATLFTIKFFTNLSNTYFAAIKNRLYCGSEKDRLCCQTVLYHTLNNTIKSIAPVLPYLAQELTDHHPCPDIQNIFKGGWCIVDSMWQNNELVRCVEKGVEMRDNFIVLIKGQKPELYDVVLYKTESFETDFNFNCLQEVATSSTSDLCEIFGSSHCTNKTINDLVNIKKEIVNNSNVYTDPEGKYAIKIELSKMMKCQRCRRYTTYKATDPCENC